jgi:Zn-dependent M28 family amino/carboxypeptidase
MTRYRLFTFLILLPACWSAHADGSPTVTAVKNIDPARVLGDITVLASDEFEGRAPGTPGEEKTIAYLRQQFIKIGLAPGNPDGSYVQQVPLASVVSKPQLSYTTNGASPVATTLSFPQDYVAWSSRAGATLSLPSSELVFVGYGVQAPEYNWDDYKGVDLRGKTLVMLINDPPLPDPQHPDQLDPTMFGGSAMTYYGRWTYKYEMAAKLGAAGALIVHETKPAAYPYEVVQNSWGRENFSIRSSSGVNPDFPPLSGWLQLDRAKELFKAGGHDFDTLKRQALSRGFKPVALGVTASASVDNIWKDVASHNVVARIEGSDPALRKETVVYTAHWDHFGIDTSLPGPRSAQIFHGAQDNASGVAALLEVARTFKALKVPPRRSIVFVITTGEERGLLGAQYYARHPLYPLDRTLVNINMDVLNTWGRTSDVEIVGYGKSTVDELAAAAATQQGRTAKMDTRPEAGRFYRSDQFEFAKAGVPVLYIKGGQQFIGQPAGFGKEKMDDYTAHDYHKISDTVRPDWDLRGAAEDIALIFNVGYAVAEGKDAPRWKDGAEFKAVRDKMRPDAHQ